MVKKMMLLAIAAAAVAAFAVPASASAEGHFTHDGKPIAGEIEEGFTGTLGFVIPGVGSLHCDVHPVIDLRTNDGDVTDLGITTTACTGTGLLTSCQLEKDALHGFPSVTPTPTEIDISGVVLTNKYKGPGCMLAGSESLLTFPSAVATPDDPDAISELTISGTGTVHSVLGPLHANATGILEADNPGTIGLD